MVRVVDEVPHEFGAESGHDRHVWVEHSKTWPFSEQV